MRKRRLLIYLLGPLVVAGAIVYIEKNSGKQEQDSSGPGYGPGTAAFENVQKSEEKRQKENSTSSEKVQSKKIVTDPAADSDMSDWEQPRFEERQQERNRMVENQIKARGLGEKNKDYPAVLDAMRHVPRHLFTPRMHRRSAYADRPLPIGSGQTISQPYIVALMTAYLEVKKGDKILEIGTGSGYQSAVLSELTPRVFSVEILEDLAETARKRLHKLGYGVIKVKKGDGYYGWEKYAPFDGIIVTCAAGHIPPPLLDQLKPDGRMIIPVGGPLEVQQLTLVSKDKEGKTSTRTMMAVRFVPMKGQIQE